LYNFISSFNNKTWSTMRLFWAQSCLS
jgi:hypothetical protein